MNETPFTDLDPTERPWLALAIAEACLTVLTGDRNVAELGREALDVAWCLLESDSIDPDEVARYVDGIPPEKDFGILEAQYGHSPKGAVVVSITLAIGYAARSAYDRVGRRDWSAVIAEIDDHSLDDVWKFAHESGALDEHLARAQANYIRTHGDALSRQALTTIARSNTTGP